MRGLFFSPTFWDSPFSIPTLPLHSLSVKASEMG